MFLKLLALFASVAIGIDCAPLDDKKQPEIVRYEYEHLPENAYSFLYELSDGQTKNEYGSFRQVGDGLVLFVKGSYSFIGDDGQEYFVRYTSDDKGFRASGAHLPDTKTDIEPEKPFALPAHIIASLAG